MSIYNLSSKIFILSILFFSCSQGSDSLCMQKENYNELEIDKLEEKIQRNIDLSTDIKIIIKNIEQVVGALDSSDKKNVNYSNMWKFKKNEISTQNKMLDYSVSKRSDNFKKLGYILFCLRMYKFNAI